MGRQARYFTVLGIIVLTLSWLISWGKPYLSYAGFVITAVGLYQLNKAIPSTSEDTYTNDQDEV